MKPVHKRTIHVGDMVLVNTETFKDHTPGKTADAPYGYVVDVLSREPYPYHCVLSTERGRVLEERHACNDPFPFAEAEILEVIAWERAPLRFRRWIMAKRLEGHL